jgi:hypothetical protein
LSTPLYPVAFIGIVATIDENTSTDYITLVDNTNGTSSLRITKLQAATDDADSDYTLTIRRTIGSTSVVTNTVDLPNSSGNAVGDNPVDLLLSMGTLQPDGVSYWEIVPPGELVEVKVNTDVETAKVVTFYGRYAILN